MTRKPHAVETCEDDVLTLEEIDAISGGVVRRRRLQAARRPNLASGPTPCPFTPASVPSPCPMQPMGGAYTLSTAASMTPQTENWRL